MANAREAKPAWIAALQRLTGVSTDTIRFNESVHRWEFVLSGADGIPRSQFWGWFHQPKDPTTGLHPFRELDDDQMRIALRNLQETFIGNPTSPSASTRTLLQQDLFSRRYRTARRRQEMGGIFADMWADRIVQITGQPWTGHGTGRAVQPKKNFKIVVPVTSGKGARS